VINCFHLPDQGSLTKGFTGLDWVVGHPPEGPAPQGAWHQDLNGLEGGVCQAMKFQSCVIAEDPAGAAQPGNQIRINRRSSRGAAGCNGGKQGPADHEEAACALVIAKQSRYCARPWLPARGCCQVADHGLTGENGVKGEKFGKGHG